jgi:hypothetical protein
MSEKQTEKEIPRIDLEITCKEVNAAHKPIPCSWEIDWAPLTRWERFKEWLGWIWYDFTGLFVKRSPKI